MRPRTGPMPAAVRTALGAGVCALAVLGGGAFGAEARSSAPATIGDLVRKAPVPVQKNTPAAADAAKAMENYKRFLELQRTDPNLRAEAMRRLGDLNQESEQLDTLDKDLSHVDLMSAEAIRLYTLLLKAYPNYERNDQVLYQMARAYEAISKPDQALATLDQLIARYPNTPMLDEVQFRRGELLFSAMDYRQATTAYAAVIKRGPASG
ncbi:MAG TPA: tetratricopeptide repeat protein, partial [Steroidobacteraceae bacterium]|nr:tetratricopeptide repeat protein [Steroidobacteraceae bacterium]